MAFVLPLPFMALELIVGIVQATVFAMLSLVYVSILTDKPHEGDEHEPDVLDADNLIGEAALYNESLT
jgi:hypothetical protein